MYIYMEQNTNYTFEIKTYLPKKKKNTTENNTNYLFYIYYKRVENNLDDIYENAVWLLVIIRI